jgi:hypothetical protein
VTFVAEADDSGGNGVAGVTVSFTVTGANHSGGTAVTDADGNASFSYEGVDAGTDTVTATYAAAGLSASATWTWTGTEPCGSGGGGGPVCAPGTAGTSVVAANFNGTPIPAGDTVWFSSVFKISGLSQSAPTVLDVTGASVSVGGRTVAVPDSVITFSPKATTSTTVFDTAADTWRTTAPTKALAGNLFASGVALPVPAGLPGGLSPVSWSATFVSAASGLSVNWQWGAAVYTSFSTDYTALGVKPTDDNQASVYQNSDHAGTPENFKGDVTGGATGGGGSNWTGSMSPTAAITPCPAAGGGTPGDLAGRWPLDEGTGTTTADTSGHGDTGLLSGGATWVPGHAGDALAFDGATGQVRIPDNTALEPANLTVNAWVKDSASPGSYAYLLAKGAQGCHGASWALYTGPSGGLEFYVSDSSMSALTVSPDAGSGIWNGAWHQVTGSFDGTTVRLYVDGTQIGSGTTTIDPIGYGLTTTNDLYLGAYPGCTGFDYNGSIDQPEIFNQALTPAQITD